MDVVAALFKHAHEGMYWLDVLGLNTDNHSADGDHVLEAIGSRLVRGQFPVTAWLLVFEFVKRPAEKLRASTFSNEHRGTLFWNVESSLKDYKWLQQPNAQNRRNGDEVGLTKGRRCAT